MLQNKRKIVEKKIGYDDCNSTAILPTDIIHIVNYAWEISFAKVDTNKKAIAAREWGLLNYY